MNFVDLVEAFPKELLGVGTTHRQREDALDKWLAAANEAGTASENEAADANIAAQAAQAIQQAMNAKDNNQSRKIIDTILHRAALRTHRKRREFLNHVKASTVEAPTERGFAPGSGEVKSAQIATCVFDVAEVVRTVAELAANVNDATRVCIHSQFQGSIQNSNNAEKACAINTAMVVEGVVQLATTISTTANTCAITLIPNFDAICAGSVTGLITAFAQIGSSGTMIAAACGHNWANAEGTAASQVPTRRLDEDVPTKSDEEKVPPIIEAPPRQLLIGGGKISTMGQCATQITGAAWSIAWLGLNINSAVNPSAGQSCPARNIFGFFGSDDPTSSTYQFSQALCASDAASALVAFFGLVGYLELVAVSCTDTLNLHAVCGAGIDQVLTATFGTVKSYIGLILTCQKFQESPYKSVFSIVRRVMGLFGDGRWVTGMNSGGGLSTPNYRRLFEEVFEPELAKLKAQFATPADVWRSIGFDIEDPKAVFFKRPSRSRTVLDKQVVELFAAPEAPASGLLQGVTCV